MKRSSLFAAASTLAFSLVTANAFAEVNSIEEAIAQGKANIQLRYRYEFVDNDGFSENAYASTLRTRVGYTTAEYKNFKAKVEFENVAALGDEDKYNDTFNGNTTRPIVADPDTSTLNQAYIDYTGIPDTKIRVGRQAINLGNLRFISTLDWRQNDRNYDAVMFQNTSIPHTKISYAFVDRVSLSTGAALDNFEGETHLINLDFDGLKDSLGTLGLYTYLADFDAPAAAARSSKTYGVNLKGKHKLGGNTALAYYLEYAHQKDMGANPVNYSVDYYHIKPTLHIGNASIGGGYEVLGSDGIRGVDTPFGLLHAFNGRADVFLNTPVNGLEDWYVSGKYRVKDTDTFADGFEFGVTYHDFSANHGGGDYGTEIDAYISKKIGKNYKASLIYAAYDADASATGAQANDVTKVYAILNVSF